jgi:hypothetical protein
MYGAGEKISIPAVGANISNYALLVVYEPAANGAYFLGELDKFVHVSPQRFSSVVVKGSGPCGLTVAVKGTVGQTLELPCIDPRRSPLSSRFARCCPFCFTQELCQIAARPPGGKQRPAIVPSACGIPNK